MPNYRATLDTMIEGRPTAEGAEVKILSEERAKAYKAAGLIEEIKEEAETKADKKAKETLAEEAKKIDTSSDKRTEK